MFENVMNFLKTKSYINALNLADQNILPSFCKILFVTVMEKGALKTLITYNLLKIRPQTLLLLKGM